MSKRNHEAHRKFQVHALQEAPRVTWTFPELDVDRRFRQTHLNDVSAALAEDVHHPISLEVARLVGLYRDDLLKCLELHERRYNKGEMPQVQIARETPRFPIEHAAQHIFACMFQEVITDTTDEDPLLHPKKAS